MSQAQIIQSHQFFKGAMPRRSILLEYLLNQNLFLFSDARFLARSNKTVLSSSHTRARFHYDKTLIFRYTMILLYY